MDKRKAVEIGKSGGGGRNRCASVGNLEDLVKRKREGRMSREREEDDIFRKCRKRARSPEAERKEEREEELKK